MGRRAGLGPLFFVLSFAALPACSGPSGRAPSPQAETTRQAFSSAGATLVDLEFDATLDTETIDPAALDLRIQAQLLFSVGQLNGESSVGRVDRADYRITTLSYPENPGDPYEVGYHVSMPVAWGGASIPSSYVLTLPRDVSDSAQTAFAAKYSASCTDPQGDDVDTGNIFLFYRPNKPGCTLDPADVSSMTATVTVAPDDAPNDGPANTPQKYPEYQRIWEDAELDLVAIFGREFDDGRAGDEGADAYQRFLGEARSYLKTLQPDASLYQESSDPGTAEPNLRLAVTLADRRKVRVDVISVPPSIHTDPVFDAWYDARSAAADVIIYSGHAGLGDNIRALMTKGIFVPKKYLIAVMNGCDTFAYVDDTLAVRRQALNPDDPAGTRYMDTVTNVLGGYFHSGDKTSILLLDGMVSAAETVPKTYRQLFDGVDKTQIMVVSGDEDNEFAPGMMPAPPAGAAPSARTAAPATSTAPDKKSEGAPSPTAATEAPTGNSGGCAATRASHAPSSFGALASATLAVLLRWRRRQVRRRIAIAIAGGSPCKTMARA